MKIVRSSVVDRSGLYSAILLKKQRPGAEITVFTSATALTIPSASGWCSRIATLDNFEKYDPPSYRRITKEFAYWDDIAVHFRGTVHRVGWQRLLRLLAPQAALILQERAR